MISVTKGPFDLPVQRKALASGQEIAFYSTGREDLQTLFFVHGLGNYAQVWLKLMDKLKDTFHCIALDLPGHGFSPASVEEERIEGFAEVLEDFVASFSIPRYALVGHSMGGQIVMQAMIRGKLSPIGIVLLAPAGFELFTDKDFAWLSSIYRGGIIEKLGKTRMVSQFRENFHQFPEDATFMLEDVTQLRDSDRYREYCNTLSRCARAVFASPVHHQLEQVAAPALVYYGQSDVMVPHRVLHGNQDLEGVCAAAISRIPEVVAFHFLPDTGHMLQWEASEEISRGIGTFITALEERLGSL
jgi:pimeloyl-ACP methyl ester carboxylesterase